MRRCKDWDHENIYLTTYPPDSLEQSASFHIELPQGVLKVNSCSSMLACLVVQLCLILCSPMDCNPSVSSVLGDSPVKNTGVACHFLLQGIFPTQGSNPGLLHCRWILYYLSQKGSWGSVSVEADGKCNDLGKCQFVVERRKERKSRKSEIETKQYQGQGN